MLTVKLLSIKLKRWLLKGFGTVFQVVKQVYIIYIFLFSMQESSLPHSNECGSKQSSFSRFVKNSFLKCGRG